MLLFVCDSNARQKLTLKVIKVYGYTVKVYWHF